MNPSEFQRLLRGLTEKAAQRASEHKKYLQRLRKKNPKNLDEMFDKLHEEIFAEIDCLECGRCCRDLGPRLTDRDTERLAKYYNMHPKTFKSQYLILDEDDDFVFRQMPCPFLNDDNSCLVYEDRPKACCEYPHTCGKGMRSRLTMMRDNIPICPAVYLMVERLIKEYPLG